MAPNPNKPKQTIEERLRKEAVDGVGRTVKRTADRIIAEGGDIAILEDFAEAI